MRTFRFRTSTEAYQGIMEYALSAAPQFDGKYADRVFMNNVFIQIDVPNPVDIGIVNFGEARWKTFLKDYVDKDTFTEFLVRGLDLKEGQELGYQVPANGKHDYGNCLFGATIATQPAEVTVISRACSFVPTGTLDIAFGSLIAMFMEQRTGRPFKLNWFLRHLQICSMRMIPLVELWGWQDKLTVPNYETNLLLRAGSRKYAKAVNEPSSWQEAGFATRRRVFKFWQQVSENGHKPYYPTLEPVIGEAGRLPTNHE